jgi:hypothetical protein
VWSWMNERTQRPERHAVRAVTVAADRLWSEGAAGKAVAHALPGHADAGGPDWAAALQALDSTAAQPLQLRVGGRWCRHWLLPLPHGLASLADLQQLATLHFERLYRAPAAAWHLAPDLHPGWSGNAAVACCAVPAALVQALHALRLHVAGVHSAALHALHQHASLLDDAAWVLCVDADSALLLQCRAGRVQRLRPWRVLDGPHDDAALARKVLAQAGLWQVPAPQRIDVIDTTTAAQAPQRAVPLAIHAHDASRLQQEPA